MVKKKTIITVILATILAVSISGSCYASSGTGGDTDTGCIGGNRSNNACNDKGLTWVYYKITNLNNAPKNSDGETIITFPSASYGSADVAYTQGRTTIVNCDSGFWLFGYDIIRGNETSSFGHNYASDGLHRSAHNRYFKVLDSNAQWSANQIYSHMTDHDIDDNIRGWIKTGVTLKDSSGNSYVRVKVTMDGSGNLVSYDGHRRLYGCGGSGTACVKNNSTPYVGWHTTFNTVQWQYGSGKHGQTGGRTMNYYEDHKNDSEPAVIKNYDDSLIKGFTLANKNGGVFAVAQKYGKVDEVRKAFEAVQNKLQNYDFWGNANSGQPSFNDVASFCYSENATFTATTSAVVYKDQSGSKAASAESTNVFFADETTGDYSVLFRHVITRTDAAVTTEAIPNKYATSPTKDGKNQTKKTGTEYFDAKNPNSSEQPQKTISDDLIKGSIGEGESVEVCSTIAYDSEYNPENKQSLSRANSDKVCVTIKRNKTATPTPGKCGSKSSTAGDNTGLLRVNNYSNGTEASQEIVASTKFANGHKTIYVYAKPGDKVNFYHNFCGGAFYAMELNEFKSRVKNPLGGLYNVGRYDRRFKTHTEKETLQRHKKDDDGNYMYDEETGEPVMESYQNEYTVYDPPEWFAISYMGMEGRLKRLDGTEEKWDAAAEGDWKKALSSYLFNYTNPTRYYESEGYDWSYENRRNIKELDPGYVSIQGTDKLDPFTTNDTGTLHFQTVRKSPNSSNITCNVKNATPGTPTDYYYQINGKANEKLPSGGWQHACGMKFTDVGNYLSQTLYLNNISYIDHTGSSNGRQEVEAQVIVPYNYLLTSTSENTNDIVFLGETMTTNRSVTVVPRKNTGVYSSAYATLTKPTEVKTKVYIERDGVEQTPALNETTETKRFNKDGDLQGTSEPDTLETVLYDDNNDKGYHIEVGDKICVKTTYWPADSHDSYFATSIPVNSTATPVDGLGNNSSIAIKEISTDKNNTIETISCSTVAKRPTMSVESSNAYSASSFQTSLYSKLFYDGGSSQYLFGSWSEYGVFGRVITNDNKTFASGAALGYPTNANTTDATYNSTRREYSNSPRQNNDNVATAANTGISSNKCVFMTQTFANKECSSSTVEAAGSSAETFSDQIKNYYGNLSSNSPEVTSATAGTHSYQASGINYNYINLNNVNLADHAVTKDSNTIYEIKTDGSAYLSSMPAVPYDAGNRTVVYNVNGNLIIDGNINDERGYTKTSLSDVTGVVILADKVWFTAAPNYINAIIIAREVNTCKFDNSTIIRMGSTLTSDVCNRQLVFDSPVVTRQIILNRTFGADVGNTSIRRAEIFNLNMANYLWSFYQMQNYNQAVTTYIRELPSRY